MPCIHVHERHLAGLRFAVRLALEGDIGKGSSPQLTDACWEKGFNTDMALNDPNGRQLCQHHHKGSVHTPHHRRPCRIHRLGHRLWKLELLRAKYIPIYGLTVVMVLFGLLGLALTRLRD